LIPNGLRATFDGVAKQRLSIYLRIRLADGSQPDVYSGPKDGPAPVANEPRIKDVAAKERKRLRHLDAGSIVFLLLLCLSLNSDGLS